VIPMNRDHDNCLIPTVRFRADWETRGKNNERNFAVEVATPAALAVLDWSFENADSAFEPFCLRMHSRIGLSSADRRKSLLM
jgi:hypothetical protein